MKTSSLVLLLLASCLCVNAQGLPQWYRVYTFEHSVIEMNTSSVVLGGNIGRVTFRWTFDQSDTLLNEPQIKYKSRIETVEFMCTDQLYRYYETSIVELNGQISHAELMQYPYKWRPIRKGTVMGTISEPACKLIAKKSDPESAERIREENLKFQRVQNFARSIKNTLEHSRDFRPLIKKFFTADFIQRYLGDNDTDWFYNLNRETALQASPAELQRFYTAQLNAGFLSFVYISHRQLPEVSDNALNQPDVKQKLIPQDVYRLINHHAYSRARQSNAADYDYLGEDIDSVAQMRSYTDLLEKIAAAMKKHVTSSRSKKPENVFDGWYVTLSDRVCTSECLGLAKGTTLYEFTLPPIRFQFAEINGQLRVVSAIDSSR